MLVVDHLAYTPSDLPQGFHPNSGEIKTLASLADYGDFVKLWDERYESVRSQLPFFGELPSRKEIVDFLCTFQHFRHSIIAGFMEPTMQVVNQRRMPDDIRRDFVKAVALSMFEEQGIPGSGFGDGNPVLLESHNALYATSAAPFGADVNREVWERIYRAPCFDTLQTTLSRFILGTAHQSWPAQLSAVSMYAFIERPDGSDYVWFLKMVEGWAKMCGLAGKELRDARIFWAVHAEEVGESHYSIFDDRFRLLWNEGQAQREQIVTGALVGGGMQLWIYRKIADMVVAARGK